jgi:thiol-disulfide isomerase/thioredoxin
VAAKVRVRVVDADEMAKLIRRDAEQPRPLIVNFWATWCEPCRAEFPDLVQIDNQYRARGLDFFTVSLDDVAELTKNVPKFLREVRAEQIPAYLLNAIEPEAAITAVDKEWRGELPATFLFDGRGQLVFKHSGRVKPDELTMAIEKVLRKNIE